MFLQPLANSVRRLRTPVDASLAGIRAADGGRPSAAAFSAMRRHRQNLARAARFAVRAAVGAPALDSYGPLGARTVDAAYLKQPDTRRLALRSTTMCLSQTHRDSVRS